MSVKEWLWFGGRLLRALPYAGWPRVPVRLFLFTGIWLLSGVLTALHWLGFALDECLFRGYRRIAVDRPVFIVGVPRSGTTWLQRVMARDPRLTSLTLWECVLAPSISERYFWRAIGLLFQPLARLLHRLPASPLDQFDRIHKLRLDEPEEDFLLLAPLHACFLMVFLCPNSPHYWRLTRFDQAVPPRRRATIMAFYHRCLQKHLYYHGRDKQILSKNPSFTPFVASLRAQFPDAKFIACVRTPQYTVPSQLSSVEPSTRFLGIQQLDDNFKQGMITQLQHYYHIIQQSSEQPNTAIVAMEELCDHLESTIVTLYEHLELELSPPYRNQLQQLDRQGRQYRSQHHYDLGRFDFSRESIDRLFADYWPIQTLMNTKRVTK